MITKNKDIIISMIHKDYLKIVEYQRVLFVFQNDHLFVLRAPTLFSLSHAFSINVGDWRLYGLLDIKKKSVYLYIFFNKNNMYPTNGGKTLV